MAISVGIYDDATLPAVIQAVNLLTPWPRAITVSDFVGETKPIKQVPLLSWVVQFREAEIRARLISHLKSVYVGYESTVETNILALPDNMVSNVLANLCFGITDLYQYSLQPRIDNIFCPSVYGVAPLWVGYYLLEVLLSDYEGDTSNDGKYRYKQLSDLREITGYTLRTILTTNNGQIVKGNKVIVSATSSSEERIVIYTDAVSLGTYLDAGNSLSTLASQWITNKYNPVVN